VRYGIVGTLDFSRVTPDNHGAVIDSLNSWVEGEATCVCLSGEVYGFCLGSAALEAEGYFYGGIIHLNVILLVAYAECGVVTLDNHVEIHLFYTAAGTGYAKLIFVPGVDWGLGFLYCKTDVIRA
jgi:hypothetical protein